MTSEACLRWDELIPGVLLPAPPPGRVIVNPPWPQPGPAPTQPPPDPAPVRPPPLPQRIPCRPRGNQIINPPTIYTAASFFQALLPGSTVVTASPAWPHRPGSSRGSSREAIACKQARRQLASRQESRQALKRHSVGAMPWRGLFQMRIEDTLHVQIVIGTICWLWIILHLEDFRFSLNNWLITSWEHVKATKMQPLMDLADESRHHLCAKLQLPQHIQEFVH